MLEKIGIKSQPGLWESLKKFDISQAIIAIKAYSIDWVEIGSCGAIGLLSGFLFKRYFGTFIMTLLVGGVSIALLDHFNWVHIDWQRLQNLIGIQSTGLVFTSLYQEVSAWVKMNVQGVVSFSVGFIIGLQFS